MAVQTIDFGLALSEHLIWGLKLRSFLDGSKFYGRETFTNSAAISHQDCEIGKWIYSQGLKELGSLDDMQELEKTHKELHCTVNRVLELKNIGNSLAAEREYKNLGPLSARVHLLLTNLALEIKWREMINDEAACYKLIRQTRWPEAITCPRCKNKELWHYTEKENLKHRCKSCNYKFSDITKTIFQKSRTPLSKWFLAIALFKKNISTLQISKTLKTTYKAAWLMIDKIKRFSKKDEFFKKLINQIEIEPGYFHNYNNPKNNSVPKVIITFKDRSRKLIIVPNIKSCKYKQGLQRAWKRKLDLATDADINITDSNKWDHYHITINKLLDYINNPFIDIGPQEKSATHPTSRLRNIIQ